MLAKSEQIILQNKVLCEDHVNKYIEEWGGLVTIKVKQIDTSHKVNKLSADLCEDCGSLGFASITFIGREGIVKRKQPESPKVFLLQCDICGSYFINGYDLKVHKKVHGINIPINAEEESNSRRVQCGLCLEVFESFEETYEHSYRVHKTKLGGNKNGF